MNIDHHIPEAVGTSKLDAAKKIKLAKAVREFESVFVGLMLKSMRNTIQKADNSTDAFGADMLEGMFDVEFSKHISQNSNLGLAGMLYRKMTGEELVKKSSARSSIGAAKRVDEGVSVNAEKVMKMQPAVRKEEKAAGSLPVIEPQRVPVNGVLPTHRLEKPTIANLVSARPNIAERDASKVVKKDAVKIEKNVAKQTKLHERIKKYDAFITEASEKHGINENLIKAVIAAESAGRANAESTQSAKGVMQLIDSTATAMGVRNVWDPRENILGGAKYLAQLLNRFDGDEKLALASYNAGPGNVIKHGGIPPFKETKQYIARVMNLVELFTQQEKNNE